MRREFESMNYSERERLAMLENRAAELERLLGRAAPGYVATEHGTGAYPIQQPGADYEGDHEARVPRGRHAAPPAGYRDAEASHSDASTWYNAMSGSRYSQTAGQPVAGFDRADYDEDEEEEDTAGGYAGDGGAQGPGEPDARTEVLVNHGRRNVRRPGRAGWRGHWRAIAVTVAGAAVGSFILTLTLPGGSAAWPASVAQVQNEITDACQNPNVVSEPTQVDFACAKSTRGILWVFSLLTSDDNPAFSNSSNGRKGLEPISAQQGGDIAWSLNLHHPYDPANPTDSLEVAARAINNIIGGATVTGANGAPVVQPGLESNPANCARYTGSSALVTRQGFPAICAQPVTSPAGQAALVADVFEQWMVGTPARIATEAGVLFENADNPGDPQVQAILNTLPRTGL